MAILYKERAVFSKGNEDRIRKIIASGRDIKKLSEIPPYFISMDLTWRCNYRCLFCLEECINRENEDLPSEIVEDIFEYSNKHKVRGIMKIGGEPFLHKQMADLVRHTKTSGIDVAIKTNGVLFRKTLAQEILGETEWIKVSINAGTGDT